MATKVTFHQFSAGSSGGTLTPPSPGSWALAGTAQSVDEQGKPTVVATWTDDAVAFANEHAEKLDLGVTANDTADFYFVPGRDVTLKALKLFTVGVPLSALGTITLAVSKNGSDNVLSTATFDLESLVTLTETDLTLTGTAANLDLDEGDYLRFRVVSNNADATATSGLQVRIITDRR
jgi:hypothetical protein